MKKFFENKLNVILSLVLIVILSATIIIGANIIQDLNSTKAIDFTGYTKTQVDNWMNENGVQDGVYTYTYSYDENIDKDVVIYQSVKEGELIKDSISFIYSNGKDPQNELVAIPSFQEMSKDEANKWALENNMNVEIVEESSKDVEEGKLISQSVLAGEEVKRSQKIKLVYSKAEESSENSNNNEGGTINVPDTYLGYKEQDFINAIDKLGLNAVKQSTTYKSDKYSTGTVYAYDSSSDGITFKQGDNVKYYLVKNDNETSSDTVTVPDSYIGYSETEFITAIEKLGLKASKQTTTYQSNKYSTGKVYAYDSSSDGISFKKGDTVKYYLVKNEESNQTVNETVTVPDSYIGYSEQDFITAIEKLGLKASKQTLTYESQKYSTGQVYAYDSSSDGITFKKGDSVKYYLVKNAESNNNNNNDTVNVPDSYLWLSESEFVSKITALGLKANKAGSKKSDNYKTGQVYQYQSSSDGITFKKGDTVNYYVVDNGSSTSEPVSDPKVEQVTLENLVGLTLAEAKANCESKGLKISSSEEYSDTVESGKIITSNPKTGTKVNKGSTVNVTVSKGKEVVEVAKGKIASSSFLISNYSKSTYDESKNAITGYFNNAGFSNVTCSAQTITSTNKNQYIGLSVGTITSILVNGSSYNSSEDYPLDSAITVTILDKEIN